MLTFLNETVLLSISLMDKKIFTTLRFFLFFLISLLLFLWQSLQEKKGSEYAQEVPQ